MEQRSNGELAAYSWESVDLFVNRVRAFLARSDRILAEILELLPEETVEQVAEIAMDRGESFDSTIVEFLGAIKARAC